MENKVCLRCKVETPIHHNFCGMCGLKFEEAATEWTAKKKHDIYGPIQLQVIQYEN